MVELAKTSRQPATRPGVLSGRMTVKSVRQREAPHLLADLPVAKNEEVPRLAQPDARRLVRGGEDPGQHAVVDRVWQEAVPDVPPGAGDLVEGLDLGGVERVAVLGHVTTSRWKAASTPSVVASRAEPVRAPYYRPASPRPHLTRAYFGS